MRERMRERILEAARTLFTEKGFEATTMRDVVEAAGTSIGNLYFYFENKSALLRTVLEEALQAAWARGEEIMSRTRPGPRRLALMQYANAKGLLMHDHPLSSLVAGVAEHESVERRLVEMSRDRARKALRENVPDLPEEHLEVAVAMWLGSGHHLLRLAARGEAGLPVPEAAAFGVRWSLRALRVPEDEIEDAVAYAAKEMGI